MCNGGGGEGPVGAGEEAAGVVGEDVVGIAGGGEGVGDAGEEEGVVVKIEYNAKYT